MKGDNKSFYEFYRKLNINIKINLRTCKLCVSKMKRYNYKFVCFNVRPAELCTKSKDLLNVSAIRTLPLQFVIQCTSVKNGIRNFDQSHDFNMSGIYSTLVHVVGNPLFIKCEVLMFYTPYNNKKK